MQVILRSTPVEIAVQFSTFAWHHILVSSHEVNGVLVISSAIPVYWVFVCWKNKPRSIQVKVGVWFRDLDHTVPVYCIVVFLNSHVHVQYMLLLVYLYSYVQFATYLYSNLWCRISYGPRAKASSLSTWRQRTQSQLIANRVAVVWFSTL